MTQGFLGPQLHADHPDIKIFIHDHNKDNVDEWANVILSGPYCLVTHKKITFKILISLSRP